MARPLIDEYTQGRGILWGEPDVEVTTPRPTLVGQDVQMTERRKRLRREQDVVRFYSTREDDERRSMAVIGYMVAYSLGGVDPGGGARRDAMKASMK